MPVVEQIATRTNKYLTQDRSCTVANNINNNCMADANTVDAINFGVTSYIKRDK